MSPLDLSTQALPLGAGDVDAGRIDALRRMPREAGRKAAVGELEVMFLTQLIQAMKKTVPENDFLPPSPARSVYEGAFDRTVAEAMAAGDPLGLGRTLGEAPGLKVAPDSADTVTDRKAQGRDDRQS